MRDVARVRARRRERAVRDVPSVDAAHALSSPRPLARAGLFAALLGVPLVVLPEAAGPYDDPKIWALPILAALTGLGWLVEARHGFFGTLGPWDRRARVLGWVIAACVTWWVITTLLSVAPLLSVLGSFGRGMGVLTLCSTAMFFFVVSAECRSASTVRSLVDVALLGSAPVTLLGLGQAFGWDPLPAPWDPAVASLTVRSTFGSHIFLGSYLVALIPLAAARVEWAFRQRREAGHWPAPTGVEWSHVMIGTAWVTGSVCLIGLVTHWSALWWAPLLWGIAGGAAWAFHSAHSTPRAETGLTAALVGGLLVAQVLVVVLSRARGAFIAMLVGLSVTGLAFLIRHRAWKTTTVTAGGLAGLALFLALLNVPGSPVASLSKLPLLSRLSQIGNVRHGSPGWFRLQVWRGILDGWRRQLGGEEVLPGLSPRVRSLTGYGPESQILVLDPLTSPFLGVLRARGAGWRARYTVDRAHSFLLDHLVTQGLVGAGLWLLVDGTLLVVGISRIRASTADGEATMRLGALGTIVAHLTDGLVGIETSMPLALFWMAAALLTCGPWLVSPAPASAAPRRARAGAWLSIATAACLTGLIAWASTRVLISSVTYADGTRHFMGGRAVAAYEDFRSSAALTPWLLAPAEAAAFVALRLAAGESDLSRRLDFLRSADATLARARRYSRSTAGSWALSGQVRFGEARAGDREQFVGSRDAFAAALRLRPDDPELLAQSAWAWLESGNAQEARRISEQALSRDRSQWLAWAVLARAAGDTGDRPTADDAIRKARELTPAGASGVLEQMLSGSPPPGGPVGSKAGQ